MALSDRVAIYAKHLREGITKTDELGEMDTNDLFIEVSRTIDKRLWFLEAHLQNTQGAQHSLAQILLQQRCLPLFDAAKTRRNNMETLNASVANQAAIEAIMSALADAWNIHDAKTYAATYRR